MKSRITFAALLVALACVLCAAPAYASELSVAPQDAEADASCALLCSDGNLWQCTKDGTAVSKYWEVPPTQHLAGMLGDVKVVYVASDVDELTNRVNCWTRAIDPTDPSGATTYDVRNVVRFEQYLGNATTFSFLTDKAGANACAVIDENTFSWLPTLTTLANFEKTKVTTIGARAFAKSGVTAIAMPPTLTTIGQRAFYGCPSLKTVTGLNKTKITTTGDYAFYGCSELTGISLPATCKTIGDSAFMNCESLTSATLGSKTTSIAGWAFANCEKLKSVNLPATCKKLGYGTFRGCSALKKVTMRSKTVVKNIKKASTNMYSAFSNTPIAVKGNKARIYVPKSVLAKYKKKSYKNVWYDYRAKFRKI